MYVTLQFVALVSLRAFVARKGRNCCKNPFSAPTSFRQRKAILEAARVENLCSMLDPEGSVEHKVNSSFPKVFLILVAMLIILAAWLLLAFSASQQKEADFYSFKVVNIRGKLVSLEKYRGSVSLSASAPASDGESSRHACMKGGEEGKQGPNSLFLGIWSCVNCAGLWVFGPVMFLY